MCRGRSPPNSFLSLASSSPCAVVEVLVLVGDLGCRSASRWERLLSALIVSGSAGVVAGIVLVAVQPTTVKPSLKTWMSAWPAAARPWIEGVVGADAG